MMKQKSGNYGTKLLMMALFLGVAAYFGIQAFHYVDDPLGVTLAYRYEVERAVDLTGFVVREERVLPDEGGGLLRIQRAEGERVAAGGTVASVYADQASLDRQAEIESLENLGVGLQRVLRGVGQREAPVSGAHHRLLHQLKDVDQQLVAGELDNGVVKITLFQ